MSEGPLNPELTAKERARKERRGVGTHLTRFHDSLMQALDPDSERFFNRVMELHAQGTRGDYAPLK